MIGEREFMDGAGFPFLDGQRCFLKKIKLGMTTFFKSIKFTHKYELSDQRSSSLRRTKNTPCNDVIQSFIQHLNECCSITFRLVDQRTIKQSCVWASWRTVSTFSRKAIGHEQTAAIPQKLPPACWADRQSVTINFSLERERKKFPRSSFQSQVLLRLRSRSK